MPAVACLFSWGPSPSATFCVAWPTAFRSSSDCLGQAHIRRDEAELERDPVVPYLVVGAEHGPTLCTTAALIQACNRIRQSLSANRVSLRRLASHHLPSRARSDNVETHSPSHHRNAASRGELGTRPCKRLCNC